MAFTYRNLSIIVVLLIARDAVESPLKFAAAAEREKPIMPAADYAADKVFLQRYTTVVELTRGDARVLLTPAWQGRVMTSTCEGERGRSFGFVHREFIAAGQSDLRFNNYGGEERLWLSPEGGPFSLWFKPGAAQTLENWYTPPALNEQRWELVGDAEPQRCTMRARLEVENAAGTKFAFDLERTVRLLSGDEVRRALGAEVAALLDRKEVLWVGYESDNRLTNRGAALSKKSGLVSIWMLGMLNSGPKTVVVAPFRGSAESLADAVTSDYFGPIPSDRLKLLRSAVLFRADAQYRSKIGLGPTRAKSVLGGIDFAAPSVTLVHFDLPEHPERCIYLNNAWGQQDDPFRGDVVNSYNDGPNDLGRRLGDFYELETLSPAAELAPGEKLIHRQRTIHVIGPREMLEELVGLTLGVSWSAVANEMFP